MFSMSPHAEQFGCQAVFHTGLKEFPWPLYAEKSADRNARGDSAIWVRDCAAAAENILPGYDGVKNDCGILSGVRSCWTIPRTHNSHKIVRFACRPRPLTWATRARTGG